VRAALLVALCSLPAAAWEGHVGSGGHLQRWRFFRAQPLFLRLVDPPAGLRLKVGGDLRTALTQAAEAWQFVESAHVPVRFEGRIAQRPLRIGEVLLQFDTGAEFPGRQNTAGFTELTLAGDQITSARIHLNAAEFNWATDGSDTALDVQSIAEHELGHALGLAHPCGDIDTQTPSCTALPPVLRQQYEKDVMFLSITPGARRALTADDIAGITALQPAAAPPEFAPELFALEPSCLETSQQIGPGLSRNVILHVGRAPDPAVLELLSVEKLVAQAGLGRDPKGNLIAIVPGVAFREVRPLDARLVGRSGKGTVLFDALLVRTVCKRRGCSSGGPTALAFLPLFLFALRNKRRATRSWAGRWKLAAGGGSFLLVLCLAAPAFAYKRSVNTGGVTIWWSPRGHPFQIDAQGTPDVPGPAAFTAIRKSFQTWAAVSCSDLSFQDQGLSQNPKDRVVGYFPGQYNRNLVLFRTRRCGNGRNGGVVPQGDPCLAQGGCGNAYDCWDHGDGVIATTTTTSNRFTGQINDSDIEVNDAAGSDGSKFIFSAVDGSPCLSATQTGCIQIDVQNTITHEAGHTMGLDHTPDPNATMYATAPPGEITKRVLGADDIQAICDIYPRGAETVTGNLDPVKLTPIGSSNGGCGCSQSQTGPGAALAALAFFLHFARRPKTKR
jgi:MYXO-CTERM domain-containing protein